MIYGVSLFFMFCFNVVEYVKILFNDFCCVNIGMVIYFEIDYLNYILIVVGFFDVGLI